MRRMGILCVVGLVVVSLSIACIGTNQQIDVKLDFPEEVDGANPIYVVHSWNVPLWVVDHRGMKTSLDLVQARGFDLLLYIDGVNYMQDRVSPRIVPAEVSGLASTVWQFRWVWRFPPNFFGAGDHEFKLVWVAPFPMADSIHTVTVNY